MIGSSKKKKLSPSRKSSPYNKENLDDDASDHESLLEDNKKQQEDESRGVSGASLDGEELSAMSSSVDSSSIPSAVGGFPDVAVTSSDGGFPSVAVILPKSSSGSHNPYFQFNGQSKKVVPKKRGGMKSINLETLYETESLESSTDISTAAPTISTTSPTASSKTSPKDISTSSTFSPISNSSGEDKASSPEVPSDVSVNSLSMSPLTVVKEFSEPEETTTKVSSSASSTGSGDSAIDFLKTVEGKLSKPPEVEETNKKEKVNLCIVKEKAVFKFNEFDSPSAFPSSPLNEMTEIILGRFEVNHNNDALYLSSSEAILAAHDRETGQRVVLKLMKDIDNFTSELDGRTNLDPTFVLPVMKAYTDAVASQPSYRGPIEVEQRDNIIDDMEEFITCLMKNTSEAGVEESADDNDHRYPYLLCLEGYDATLTDTFSRNSNVSLGLARKVTRDVVVGLILLHTENKIHGNITPRSIVRIGSQWKLTDFGLSRPIGDTCDMTQRSIAYCPPEVAAKLLECSKIDEECMFTADTVYDLWSLGCILYQLILGSPLWNSDNNGYISTEDLTTLARWSPQSFLKRAYLYFPPDERSDNERAAIDLISKLLMPTSNDRRANFDFGIVSIHQHEFLEGQPLEAESLVGFGERQAVMLRSESERQSFVAMTKNLSLEETWELNRARDVLLLGVFETTDVHTPTSFVVLTQKLPPVSTVESEEVCQRRLNEGLKWVELFQELGNCVKGALNGDVSSVGQFWAKLKSAFFIRDYVYFYFIDDLTGEPVRAQDNNRYPIEIKSRSDLLPKLLPLMQLTMRSMALYHGVAGLARMFGCPLHNVSHEIRKKAQPKVNELKNESSASPFGVFADDVKELRTNKEQFLKKDSVRCKSLHVLVRFLEKKIGHDGDFAGLSRLAEEGGRAIWTTLDSAQSVQEAIKNRAEERLKEEKNLWVECQDSEIDNLRRLLFAKEQQVASLEASLKTVKEECARANYSAKEFEMEANKLNSSLLSTKKVLDETETQLEKEKNKMKLLWISKKQGTKKKQNLSSTSNCLSSFS